MEELHGGYNGLHLEDEGRLDKRWDASQEGGTACSRVQRSEKAWQVLGGPDVEMKWQEVE